MPGRLWKAHKIVDGSALDANVSGDHASGEAQAADSFWFRGLLTDLADGRLDRALAQYAVADGAPARNRAALVHDNFAMLNRRFLLDRRVEDNRLIQT